jgi:hypothetical protein
MVVAQGVVLVLEALGNGATIIMLPLPVYQGNQPMSNVGQRKWEFGIV